VGKGGGLVPVLPRHMIRLGLKANGSYSDEDRHEAPASTPPFPLSLQNPERLHYPFGSSNVIR